MSNKSGIMSGVRKKGQGGLTKQERLDAKLAKAEEKMKTLEVKLKGELTEASELIVSEYVNYIKFLDDVAQGRIKEASVTARIGACDKLIKRVDELRQELEMDGVDPDSLDDVGGVDSNNLSVDNEVISLFPAEG